MTHPITVIEISSPGAPEVLVPAERPCPEPQGNQVLIEVAAAGVNRPDVLQRMGLYPPPPGASDIPGLEVAGEIIATGPDVSRWEKRDRVCALISGGGYATHALADAGSCLPVPDGFSMVEAAALPETFFTVWTNVFEDGCLTKGERLLVHGGTSGIGTAAIMLANAFGAEAFATAGTDDKCVAAEKIGAAKCFNYRDDDWSKALQDMGGVDVVLDMVGGDYVAKNLAALRPGGRHISIAFQRGVTGEVNIVDIMRKRLMLTGSTLRARPDDQKAVIASALETHVWPKLGPDLKPVIDKTFPLKDAALAHARMESGAHVGKIVLETGQN